MFISPKVLVRVLLIVLACLVLASCQLWPFKRQEGGGEQPRAAEETTPAAGSIGQAIALLQEGREARAQVLLVEILERNPGSSTAKLLLAQIRQPPEELLGDSFEEIEIRPGDSLSAIAGRTVDNELLFYALARLNEIEVPRLLRPGQRIRVPAVKAMDTEMIEDAAKDASALDQPNQQPREQGELTATAGDLMQREHYRQAYALLLSSARAGKLEADGDALLASAAVALARAACRRDDPEQALKMLNQASPWLSTSAEEGRFADQRSHVEARLDLGRAEQALAQGEHAAAFELLLHVRELAVDLRQTHGRKLEDVENALVEYYHDGAVSAWRDQKVGLSIDLWERVVRIDPDFEPALRYLERARRARRELQALEPGQD